MIRNLFSRFDEFWIGLIVAFIFSLAHVLIDRGFINVPFKEVMDLKILDKKFSLKQGSPSGDEIVILAVDQKSLEKYRKWPWERELFARAVKKLSEMKAKVIGFDIIFAAEIDETIGQAFDSLEAYLKNHGGGYEGADFRKAVNEVKSTFQGEKEFSRSIENFGNVVLGYKLHSSEELSEIDVEDLRPHEKFTGNIAGFYGNPDDLNIKEAVYYRQSLPLFRDSTKYQGYINTSSDWDGIHRSVPLVYKFKDEVLSAFSVVVADRLIGSKDQRPIFQKIQEYGLYEFYQLRIGDKAIPVDQKGHLRIRFYGPRGQFKYISFTDLIEGKVKSEQIEGKIVLCGATAPILHDLKPTPFGPDTPGVEIHATIIDNILHGNFLSRNEVTIVLYEVLMIILFGMILGLTMKHLPLWSGIPIIVVLMSAYIIFDLYYLFPAGKLVVVLIPFIELLSLYIVLAIFKFAVVEGRTKDIKNKFKHYVADAVVDEMVERKDLNLGMVKKNLTVLFADIRSFATISEKLEPALLEKILNKHMTILTDAILENGGTVDKYMGDAIMAIFGAPLDLEDHAYFACRAAFRMIEKLRSFNRGLEEDGLPPFKIGVGISTGEVLVGNMGSEYLYNYTVLGSEVNIASRIEELNKQYGTNIIISEATLASLKGRGVVRKLGGVQVKGIEREVNIYSLSGIKGMDDESWSQVSRA